jgi:dienelactone hydrolase
MIVNNRRTFAAAVVAIIFVTALPSIARDSDQLPRGEVIEKVTSNADPQQSYALFLPSAYTPEKKWPILYAFDPAARGKVPVSLFKEAAERFGYIVVGSNNSRNGISVGAIIEALWADTHQRFSIDERRVYTSGFSGGARVASSVASTNPGAVAGVIACSGGFPGNISPSSSTPFVFFGTAGTEDFNFPEMQQLKRKLDGAGVANALAIFEGGHDWAPPELCAEAMSWMEVQAMKAGRRAKDEALIAELLKEKTREARGYETSKNIYEAYLAYETIAAEFKGLHDVSQFEASAVALRTSKEVKEAVKNEKADEEKQTRLTASIQRLGQPGIPTVEPPEDQSAYAEPTAQFRSAIAELTRQSEQNENIRDRRVARRVLQSLFIGTYEEVSALYQKKNYSSIPGKLERAAAIRPQDARVFYDLAAAYSRLGNKNKSLAALGRAIENGFADAGKIEQNEDFAAIRNEAKYKRLLASLRKTS